MPALPESGSCLHSPAPQKRGLTPAPDPEVAPQGPVLEGAACGRGGVVKAGSILVSCKRSCVRDTPSGPVSEYLVCVAIFGNYITWEMCLLHLGYSCFQVGPCATAELEGFSHHRQGPTLRIMGYVDWLTEPNLPVLSPTSRLSVPPSGGSTGLSGLLPAPWPWGPCSAQHTLPAAAPSLPTPPQEQCCGTGGMDTGSPARSLSLAWLGQMGQGKECLTWVSFPQFRQTRIF